MFDNEVEYEQCLRVRRSLKRIEREHTLSDVEEILQKRRSLKRIERLFIRNGRLIPRSPLGS